MTNSQENKGWLETLIEGGIPQLVAGPAGKAISRLLGAGVEIPAAWLEQKAQAIRDETKAKSHLMESLAEKSAELGFSDPQLLERGLNNMLGKAYRAQENREDVAIKAVEYLNESGPLESGEGPKDDWIDIFEEYASKATTESIRDMYGRVLAGEIRTPGKFSRSLLHFISILDGNVATLIQKISPFIIDNVFVPRDNANIVLNYKELLSLEECGFLTLGTGSLELSREANNEGYVVFGIGKECVIVSLKDKNILRLPAYKLTSIGEQLISTISTKYDIDTYIKFLKNLNIGEVFRGVIVVGADGTYFTDNIIRV